MEVYVNKENNYKVIMRLDKRMQVLILVRINYKTSISFLIKTVAKASIG